MKTGLYIFVCNLFFFASSIFSAEDIKVNNHAFKQDVRWGKVVSALLIWGQESVLVPGPKRFYEVALASDDGLIGIISGKDMKSVQAIAKHFRTYGSLPAAKCRAAAIDNISNDLLNDISCTSKKVTRLCDLLLPVEVQRYTNTHPCTHEGFACEKYWVSIKQELAQLVMYSCEHHEAVVMIPHLVPMQ